MVGIRQFRKLNANVKMEIKNGDFMDDVEWQKPFAETDPDSKL